LGFVIDKAIKLTC